MISEEELNEIELRCLAAQPGEWKAMVEGIDVVSGSDFIQTGPEGEDLELVGGTMSDLLFVAHAKADILRLVAEVRRLRSMQAVKP